jgi:hypothetical protein
MSERSDRIGRLSVRERGLRAEREEDASERSERTGWLSSVRERGLRAEREEDE